MELPYYRMANIDKDCKILELEISDDEKSKKQHLGNHYNLCDHHSQHPYFHINHQITHNHVSQLAPTNLRQYLNFTLREPFLKKQRIIIDTYIFYSIRFHRTS